MSTPIPARVPSPARMRWIASFVLLCVAVIWGGSYLVVKDLLRTMPPATYLTLRFAIALPLVVLIYWKQVSGWMRTEFAHGRTGGAKRLAVYLSPGVFLIAAFWTQSYGIKASSPGVAAFLTSLLFCFIPLFEVLAGEHHKAKYLVAPLVCSLIGTALLTNVISARISMGDILLLLCAVAYAGQIYFSSKIARGSHFSIAFVTQGTIVLLAAVVAMVCLDGLPQQMLSPADIGRLLYLTLIATVVCYLLQFWAQQYVRSRYVGFIYTIEPVAALILSVAFGYESVDVRVFLGADAILLGVAAAIWSASVDKPN